MFSTNKRMKVPPRPESASPEIDLGIAIPAYREEARIAESLRLISEWMDSTPLSVMVKVIVEKSPDNTLEVAQKALLTMRNSERFEIVDNLVQRGKGYAVRSGMRRVGGKVRLFMDADLSVPLKEIDGAVSTIMSDGGPDVLIGTRHDGGHVMKKQGIIRRVGSRGYNLILRALGLTGVSDTQCGFKLFKSAAADAIFRDAEVDGFGFDIELLLLAKKHGFSVGQIPVEWYNAEGSKFDPMTDGPRVLLDALKTRIKLGAK